MLRGPHFGDHSQQEAALGLGRQDLPMPAPTGCPLPPASCLACDTRVQSCVPITCLPPVRVGKDPELPTAQCLPPEPRPCSESPPIGTQGGRDRGPAGVQAQGRAIPIPQLLPTCPDTRHCPAYCPRCYPRGQEGRSGAGTLRSGRPHASFSALL